MSSRNLIFLQDGEEDAKKSRRVEFRYLLSEENKIEFIKKNLK